MTDVPPDVRIDFPDKRFTAPIPPPKCPAELTIQRRHFQLRRFYAVLYFCRNSGFVTTFLVTSFFFLLFFSLPSPTNGDCLRGWMVCCLFLFWYGSIFATMALSPPPDRCPHRYVPHAATAAVVPQIPTIEHRYCRRNPRLHCRIIVTPINILLFNCHRGSIAAVTAPTSPPRL